MSRFSDPLTRSVSIQQYSRGLMTECAGEILKEYGLSLYVNSHMLILIRCLPSYLEELVVGYLFAEGLITSFGNIASCHIEKDTGRANVWLRDVGTVEEAGLPEGQIESEGRVEPEGQVKPEGQVEPEGGHPEGTARARSDEAERLRQNAEPEQMALTDWGDAMRTGGVKARSPLCPVKRLAYDCERVLRNANRLLAHSELFRKTGNVHAVMLCREEEMLCCMEDVGRFSAFDKCVGCALMKGWDLRDVCAYTTGRVPSALVLKAVRTGIPMLVSRSAPTDAALTLAERYGVGIVGFARGDRMNVYC
ncbi:MAG: formate dehydrogenase accessory sulfurtransferase FdhD [Peptococcaceae bacterium]|nr:formate dehydrogenase accessory sulfurtransferase FdhD [Peptococcaceae bacterium]